MWIEIGINRRQGYDYKCTQILANQALELHAGDINKPADTNQFGACYARGAAMIGWGYDKTTGRRWATLGGTDDSSPLLGGVIVDTGRSPAVSATGCIVSFPIAGANGGNLTGTWGKYNGLGGLVIVHIQYSKNGALGGGLGLIATIPAPYRPTSQIKIVTNEAYSGQKQELWLDTNGQVSLLNNTFNPTYIYADFLYYV